MRSTVLVLGIALGVSQIASASRIPHLTPSERSALRYRIENLWNEVDLLVKNAETNRRDVKRQERELRDFRVFDKLPLLRSGRGALPELEKRIAGSAQAFGLKLTRTQIVGTNASGKPIPPRLVSDDDGYQLTEDQMVEKLRLDLTVAGSKRGLQDWMDSWNQVLGESGQTRRTQTPLMEWDPAALTSLPTPAAGASYLLHVQAYCFRDIRFPKIRPRDPVSLLPAWARRDPAVFRGEEPFLWDLVERTRSKIPDAIPQYDLRAELELNSERMTFFTSKVSPTE